MAIIKYINKLVPEVNYWTNRTLFNNQFNRTFIKCPTKISDYWRSPDSVVELIFNETANPSGKQYEDGYHFMWKYRTINVNKLFMYEPMLFKRVQVYYNNTWIYVPKEDEKYKDICNLSNESISLSEQDYDYPYGVKPTKYVGYKTHIVTSGSDQLHYNDPDYNPESEVDPEIIVYSEEENVFGLTEEELKMCEYLYYYRTGQYELIKDIDEQHYYTLQSCLSKWILVYLLCYLYNIVKYELLNTICKKRDGSFRCLVEKHIQDRIYEYIQKHNMELWENVFKKDNNDVRSFVPYTFKNNTCILKGIILDSYIQSGGIILADSEKIIDNYNNVEFIVDGLKLKQGEDYIIKNISSESSKKMRIEFLSTKKIEKDKKYQIMYNYIIKKVLISGVDDIDNI